MTIGAFDKLSQQVQNRRGHMEEARSSLESHKSRGQLSESLLEQSRLGNISGIYGRLVIMLFEFCLINYFLWPHEVEPWLQRYRIEDRDHRDANNVSVATQFILLQSSWFTNEV